MAVEDETPRDALARELINQISDVAQAARQQWASYTGDLSRAANEVSGKVAALGEPLLDGEATLIAEMAGLLDAMADVGERMVDTAMGIPNVTSVVDRFDRIARRYGLWALDRAIGSEADMGPARPPRRLTFTARGEWRAVAVANDLAVPAAVTTTFSDATGWTVTPPNVAALNPNDRVSLKVTADGPEPGLFLLTIELSPEGADIPAKLIPVVLEFLHSEPVGREAEPGGDAG